MLAQRTMQQSLRRAAMARPSLVPRLALINASQMLTRNAASSAISPSKGDEILAAQRLNRPVSPHLGIYKPQITWYPSMFHRITGSILSGAFYLFGFGYLIAPAFGWHLESHALITTMAGLSIYSKLAIKTTLVLPFMFHCWNGVRHLMWDVGIGLTNKAIAATGWSVVGISVLSTLAALAV